MAPSSRAKTPRQTKLSFANATKNPKPPAKKTPANGNILNFFKKVEVEEQLFIAQPESTSAIPSSPSPYQLADKRDEEDIYGIEDDAVKGQFTDEQGPRKRRKLSHDSIEARPSLKNEEPTVHVPNVSVKSETPKPKPTRRSKKKGPFLDDSDSDDDSSTNSTSRKAPSVSTPPTPTIHNPPKPEVPPTPKLPIDESCPDIMNVSESTIPNIKQEETLYEDFRELDDIDGLFGDGEYEEGEEFRERRFMEEQARLEAEDVGNYTSDDFLDEPSGNEIMARSCPLCNASLEGLAPDQSNIHVNACLDGNPIPLPKKPSPPPEIMVNLPQISTRFAKAAVPRPGQDNPIDLGSSSASKPTSAFSKLMSGHAEDAAWASAAATEHASRGKPAYQRTCPFYKIMPGFYICVDAFRYGAVEGCSAYFLSHFHSDHYIGLTANWSHGPIYCSRVTGSLIKNQLKTNAKWIKEIEFEEKIEVPGTEGVTVTMLPANHCPGSSLYLFEKTIGKGLNPRVQRILHCGDFRACPAQVSHELLKPETIDAVSGKVKQQKIDICYLDTTYLNPRYSFPPQDDVIRACAEFCKSISGDPNAADEAFDALRREKGSVSVSKFFQKESGDADVQGKLDDCSDKPNPKNRLLVVCGTYSIGKERICKAIAQALHTKIFASPAKIKICQQLGDPELSALMTSDPRAAQVHMQMLMEIRAETLQEYLNGYKPHFTRIVGFRPSGWNFRGSAGGAGTARNNVSASTSPGQVPTTHILHGPAWRPRFGASDFAAQRGSTREAMCFGVPYSEHSSFRELALFVMGLRIEKVVPTVNIGSDASRRRMKGWIDRWMSERRKGGIVRVLDEKHEDGDRQALALWEGKDGRGGYVVW
ncbi:DRMBL-domain-containing protein [Xylariaceae sp. FL0016]|nr:DRMBL-domain-containing protein [Xylariaceae sp. FL0016]